MIHDKMIKAAAIVRSRIAEIASIMILEQRECTPVDFCKRAMGWMAPVRRCGQRIQRSTVRVPFEQEQIGPRRFGGEQGVCPLSRRSRKRNSAGRRLRRPGAAEVYSPGDRGHCRPLSSILAPREQIRHDYRCIEGRKHPNAESAQAPKRRSSSQ